MDFADDTDPQIGAEDTAEDVKTPAQDKALVQKILKNIKADKAHHAKAFKRMRRDMQVATWGAEEAWGEDKYRANIAGRHVKQKTAALYAKNPRVAAKRKEQIDYVLWDENPQSLMMAMQTIQLAQQATQIAATQPPQADPVTGMAIPAPIDLPPGFEQAQALVADFQQGTERRQMFDKIGKTLEILFGNALANQQPVPFKRGMKSVVRRSITTGVGYVELGFQREMGPRAGLEEQLADARTRLDHLKKLSEELSEGELDDDSAEMAELEHSITALQSEPEIVLREGLIVEYPTATKVIPDKLCKSLDGFVGARHIAVEYTYTSQEVEEIFGVDLKDGYTSYTSDPGSMREISANDVMDDDYSWTDPETKKNGLVCVWKYYDKPTGLVYYVADGYPGFLRLPAAPDVFVETFWPLYALTFNAVENDDELFPPSDVSLMIDMQREHNRSRQGKREHRDAARPRWVSARGAFGSEEDPLTIKNMRPFDLAMIDMAPDQKIGDLLQVVPVPGVDPNLYDTGEVFTDTQIVVGSQEAQFGGVSKATATESAIAANSSTSADGSSIDELDEFLSTIARAGGQILQKEMSEEIVKQIVGPGAVWPAMTLAEIAGEVHLEVAAGSTGKPNQAVEINNMERMLPMLIQLPSINQEELAREVLRRLDDRMDLTKMIVANAPSIVAQNQNAQPSTGNAATDPNAQGAQGASNGAAPPGGPGGSGPAFGSNQV